MKKYAGATHVFSFYRRYAGFSRRLQDLQRDLTKCWWMANSLGSHMKHNEFLGKASERYANYVMDNISNASDGLDRIIAIAKMKIGQ